jgi:hypothetical protein
MEAGAAAGGAGAAAAQMAKASPTLSLPLFPPSLSQRQLRPLLPGLHLAPVGASPEELLLSQQQAVANTGTLPSDGPLSFLTDTPLRPPVTVPLQSKATELAPQQPKVAQAPPRLKAPVQSHSKAQTLVRVSWQPWAWLVPVGSPVAVARGDQTYSTAWPCLQTLAQIPFEAS